MGTCGLLLVLVIVFACGSPTSVSNDVDYNRYLYSHGIYGYTGKQPIFFCNNYLYSIDDNESHMLRKVCKRANCNHSDSTCSAWLDTDSIYVQNGRIYYISSDKLNHYALYHCNEHGEDRKRVCALPFLDVSGAGFSWRLCGSIVVFDISYWSLDGISQDILYLDLDHLNKDATIAFHSESEIVHSYVAPETNGSWIIVKSYDLLTKECSLLGYSLATNETVTISSEWNKLNILVLLPETMNWFSPGDGFYSLDLHTMASRKLWDCKISGFAMFDDSYIYISNANNIINYENVFGTEETQGLYIYTYDGHLQSFLPFADEAQIAGYLGSSPQKVFFMKARGSLLPSWYIDKDEIGTSSITFHGIKQ